MLVLKNPIPLISQYDILSLPLSLNYKIPANYQVMAAQLAPKDLFFLLTAPVELGEALPGMSSLFIEENNTIYQKLDLQMVNLLLNRILLGVKSSFTYQDTVYISSFLQKLGITPVPAFMSRLMEMVSRTQNMQRLLCIYQNHFQELSSLAALYENRFLEMEGDNQAIAKAAYTNVHMQMAQDIYKRLDTANLYKQMAAYQKDEAQHWSYLSKNEWKLAEHIRSSQQLALFTYQQTLFHQQAMPVFHFNPFEWGLYEKSATHQTDVYCNVAKALLCNLVEQTLLLRGDQMQAYQDFWIDGTRAYAESAENLLSRYLSFHQEERTAVSRQYRYSQNLSLFYQAESEVLQNLIYTGMVERKEGGLEGENSLSISQLFAHYKQSFLQNVHGAYENISQAEEYYEDTTRPISVKRSLFASYNGGTQRDEYQFLKSLWNPQHSLSVTEGIFNKLVKKMEDKGISQQQIEDFFSYIQWKQPLGKAEDNKAERKIQDRQTKSQGRHEHQKGKGQEGNVAPLDDVQAFLSMEKSDISSIEEQIRLTQQQLLTMQGQEKQKSIRTPLPFSILEQETFLEAEKEAKEIREPKSGELKNITSVSVENAWLSAKNLEDLFQNQYIWRQIFSDREEFQQSFSYQMLTEELLAEAAAPYFQTIYAIKQWENSIQNGYGMEADIYESDSIEQMISNTMLSVETRLALWKQYIQALYYSSVDCGKKPDMAYPIQKEWDFHSIASYFHQKNLLNQDWQTNNQKNSSLQKHSKNISITKCQSAEETKKRIENKIHSSDSYFSHSMKKDAISVREGYQILQKQLEQLCLYQTQWPTSYTNQHQKTENSIADFINIGDYTIPPFEEGLLTDRNHTASTGHTEAFQEHLQEINRKNRLMQEKITKTKQQNAFSQNLQADRKKTICQSQLALHNPASALLPILKNREHEQNNMLLPMAMETALTHIDESAKKIYEEVLLYESNPQRALERGFVKPGNPAMLNISIMPSQEKKESENFISDKNREAFPLQERACNIVEDARGIGRTLPVVMDSSRTPLIHKPQEGYLSDSIMEYLSAYTSTVPAIKESKSVTKTTVKDTVDSPEFTKKMQESFSKNAEDVNRLIEQTLVRQLGVLSEKVFSQMERRLVLEQARRGRY